MACTCGHAPEDHMGEVGSCKIEDCTCAGYEEEDEEDDDY